jgi:class 3 adenylate cyclase
MLSVRLPRGRPGVKGQPGRRQRVRRWEQRWRGQHDQRSDTTPLAATIIVARQDAGRPIRGDDPTRYSPSVPRSKDWSLVEREIKAIDRFPGENPNPVLRTDADGRLVYANDAAAPIIAAWGASVGELLLPGVARALRDAAAGGAPRSIEVASGHQTFAVLAVFVPDLGVYNLYGTDITAAKVVERFPGSNPNPVLRMTPAGDLQYANEASLPITRALRIEVGDRLSADLLVRLRARLADPAAPSPEVPGEGGRTYRLTPVVIPEFEFVNLYGTDITAEKAIDKFPNQNPNPVLRLTRNGRMTYANPASDLVRKALGADVGDQLDPALFARIVAASENLNDPTMEVEADGTIYRLRIVSVYEFDSINLYGTDITAARQVERLNAENEALLLNILPRTIAERLRGGETVIADRFDDMAVLFADVVGFTELSSRLSPTEVVGLLNEVFTMCDRLADQFGLEKIKTVGDAYMVAGGLHIGEHGRRATHAEDVADMGLAMLTEVSRLGAARGIPLQIRVGMNVGPAVAGVIGLKKFIYDVWGDTVNTASRMESTGVPSRFQVTPETQARLRDQFEFEPRGPVEVKGKGTINTWFLVGRRPTRAPRDQAATDERRPPA